MLDPRKYGYKRLETDDEFRERILKEWGNKIDSWAQEVLKLKGEDLDAKGWVLHMQRRIVDVY